jgi:hypothetical protein
MACVVFASICYYIKKRSDNIERRLNNTSSRHRHSDDNLNILNSNPVHANNEEHDNGVRVIVGDCNGADDIMVIVSPLNTSSSSSAIASSASPSSSTSLMMKPLSGSLLSPLMSTHASPFVIPTNTHADGV